MRRRCGLGQPNANGIQRALVVAAGIAHVLSTPTATTALPADREQEPVPA
jgi:hypothetical protein